MSFFIGEKLLMTKDSILFRCFLKFITIPLLAILTLHHHGPSWSYTFQHIENGVQDHLLIESSTTVSIQSILGRCATGTHTRHHWDTHFWEQATSSMRLVCNNCITHSSVPVPHCRIDIVLFRIYRINPWENILTDLSAAQLWTLLTNKIPGYC